MKTYPIYDSQKQLLAFEIENDSIGRHAICRVVRTISGATLIRKPKVLSWFREEVFCEFTVDGGAYIAEEPYGDSNRYWIGPISAGWLAQTEKVHDAFVRV